MPATYSIRGPLLRLDLIGDYEIDDIVRTFHGALADPSCPARFDFLVDVSRSTSLETRTPEDVRRLAEALQPHATRIGGKCAVIAVRDVHYGLSRMGAAFSAEVGVEAQVFRDERTALAWLGVDPRPGGTAGS